MSHDADNQIVIRPGEGALVHGMNMVHKVDAGRLEGGLLIMEGRDSCWQADPAAYP